MRLQRSFLKVREGGVRETQSLEAGAEGKLGCPLG